MFINVKTTISNLVFHTYTHNIENSNLFKILLYFIIVLRLLNEFTFFVNINLQKKIIIKIKSIFFFNILYFRLFYGTFIYNKKFYPGNFYKNLYFLILSENYKPIFYTYLIISTIHQHTQLLSNESALGFYIGLPNKIYKIIHYFTKNKLDKIQTKILISYYKNKKKNGIYNRKITKCVRSVNIYIYKNTNPIALYKKSYKNNTLFDKINTQMLKLIGDIPSSVILPPEKTLFIRKLNPLTNEEDLHTLFTRFGKVSSINIITDKHTGHRLNYGFVAFSSKKNCANAIFNLNEWSFSPKLIKPLYKERYP
uniref:Peptidyl-prolyl cis-trans isomerase n=1 Tax=Lotharella vacuolata TaxID=74820 RepID=A0A0H5BKU3_9EUKA|nr:peptidyl prolyl cis-trans isomerase [Lotharella vacuolata]